MSTLNRLELQFASVLSVLFLCTVSTGLTVICLYPGAQPVERADAAAPELVSVGAIL